MKSIFLSIFSCLVLPLILQVNVTAQTNKEFSKANFKSNKKGLKLAKKKIHYGDVYNQMSDYDSALENYLSANKFNANNSELNAKIGATYFNNHQYSEAINYLKKGYEIDNQLDGEYVSILGSAYQHQNEFHEAIKFYGIAEKLDSKINPNVQDELITKIKSCVFAKELVQKPISVEIINLTDAINSKNEEYVPVITADESEMFFTSRRENSVGGNIDPGISDYYEDIYYSKKENGVWTEAVGLGIPVNSELHDATIGLSFDGQKLFLYRDNEKGIGGIFVTKKSGDIWSEPIELPSPINSEYTETSACFSPDERTIYFVSDRPDGNGGKDIYKASYNSDGTWGNLENLGDVVNTTEDEDAVFLHPDGKTLYFSSKGHNTMGGFDIFKSTFENDKWSIPENIGYPVNTTEDDICFVLTASGNHGYYTSIKPEGKGKRDIYKVIFLDELDKPKLTLLKGVISDKKTGDLLGATIEIYDNNEGELVGTFESNSATGKFMISLPAGRNYGINVKKQNYLFFSENFNIPANSAFQEVEKNVELDEIEIGEKVVLKNIFYDYNKSSLNPSSYNELRKVIELLNSNPNMKLELSAHTDSRGTNTYNEKLSQSRAQSCVEFLVEQGIDRKRLIAKGYGEKQLLVKDDEINALELEEEKEIQHQKNRRTEFKIIEN